MPGQLKVGIIGCGEVAQIIHIPSLRELQELFSITALCDVSPSVLAAVGAGLPEAARFATPGDLIGKGDVDAVLIANPHVFHAEVARMAIEAGKHVLIEKPACTTLDEMDGLIAIEGQADVTVQVGFMRRYAPAFLEAVERLAGRRDEIVLARVRDVIGANAIFIGSTSLVHRPADDVPAEALSLARERMAARTEEAIGTGSGPMAAAYSLLLGLGSHDTSAMRELIGMPKSVLYAAQRSGGRFITAAFDYGHFVCHFEAGVDSIGRFDACLEVGTRDEMVRVDYDTPYIRHVPARLTVTRGAEPAGISVEERFTTRNDSFVAEWRAFHDNVTRKQRPKTSLSDAREDLVLFREMARLMARTGDPAGLAS